MVVQSSPAHRLSLRQISQHASLAGADYAAFKEEYKGRSVGQIDNSNDLELSRLRSQITQHQILRGLGACLAIGSLGGLATGTLYGVIGGALGAALGVGLACRGHYQLPQLQQQHQMRQDFGEAVQEAAESEAAKLVTAGPQPNQYVDKRHFLDGLYTAAQSLHDGQTGETLTQDFELNLGGQPIKIHEDRAQGLVTLSSPSGQRQFSGRLNLPGEDQIASLWSQPPKPTPAGLTAFHQNFDPNGNSEFVAQGRDDRGSFRNYYPVHGDVRAFEAATKRRDSVTQSYHDNDPKWGIGGSSYSSRFLRNPVQNYFPGGMLHWENGQIGQAGMNNEWLEVADPMLPPTWFGDKCCDPVGGIYSRYAHPMETYLLPDSALPPSQPGSVTSIDTSHLKLALGQVQASFAPQHTAQSDERKARVTVTNGRGEQRVVAGHLQADKPFGSLGAPGASDPTDPPPQSRKVVLTTPEGTQQRLLAGFVQLVHPEVLPSGATSFIELRHNQNGEMAARRYVKGNPLDDSHLPSVPLGPVKRLPDGSYRINDLPTALTLKAPIPFEFLK